MNKLMWIPLVVVLSVTVAGMAWAADKAPKNEEQDWEKHPEPALQVYKTTGRGLHALVYHSLKSLREGNEHFPILGSVKIFEGIGTGLVELSTSTYKGMAGSKPKPYDVLSKPNHIINSDPVLRNARQVGGTAVVTGGAGIAVVGGLYAGQKATDQFPPDVVETENGRRAPGKRRMTVPEAQRRYVPQRTAYGREIERGRGNLLKQLRYPE